MHFPGSQAPTEVVQEEEDNLMEDEEIDSYIEQQ